MVFAPPASMTPPSARTHSILVLLAIATRSSGCNPRASKPAAIRFISSPASFQDRTRHVPSPAGEPKAGASGVAATRSRMDCRERVRASR